MRFGRPGFLLGALLAAALAGCSALPTPAERLERVDVLARSSGWERQELPAGRYRLVAYLPSGLTDVDTLHVFMEGDGFAWASGHRPSDDPTPLRAIGLELAMRHADGPAAYLARPCQFRGEAVGEECERRDWTGGRFSADIVAAVDVALDALKERVGARHIVLIGYSGGAAVAVLASARRDDVAALVTVAGNLDHVAWTQAHRVTGLRESLNPAEEWAAVRSIRQIHFAGLDDKVVPAAVIDAYAARFPLGERPVVRYLSGFDHECCWVGAWPDLWREVVGTFVSPR